MPARRRSGSRRARRILPAALLVLACCARGDASRSCRRRYWAQYVAEVRASTLYAQNWHLAERRRRLLRAPRTRRRRCGTSGRSRRRSSSTSCGRCCCCWRRSPRAGRRSGGSRSRWGRDGAEPRLARCHVTGGRAGVGVLRHADAGVGVRRSAALLALRRRPRVPRARLLRGVGLGRDRARRPRSTTPATPFPGVAALLPVARRAGGDRRRVARRARRSSAAPSQWLGDVSYARLPVALAAARAGAVRRRRRVHDPRPRWWSSCSPRSLAWLTKLLVEDPLRFRRGAAPGARRRRRSRRPLPCWIAVLGRDAPTSSARSRAPSAPPRRVLASQPAVLRRRRARPAAPVRRTRGCG